MWLERVSGGGADLIDLDDAKAHLRIIGDDLDQDVRRCVRSASYWLDVDDDGFGGIGFPILKQSWRMKGASFSQDFLRFPFPHVGSVQEICYFDRNSLSQVLPASQYFICKVGRHYQISLHAGASWPSVANRPDAIEVQFSCGYPDVASVPGDIQAAARLLVGHFFENRLSEMSGEVPEKVKIGVDALTRRYRPFAM